MQSYKEMYLMMVRATEKAMNELIETQRKCEELYIKAESEENKENEENKK